MKTASIQLQQEVIQQYCRQLRAPAMAAQFRRLAETAASQQQSHLDYLEALLGAEMEEREQNTIQLRLKEAHLPKLKTLDEFQFTATPHIAASKLKELADGGYIERAEPVLFIGDSGTGKTHLLIALCVAACRQKRRVRFATATGLVNELVEAQHQHVLGRAFKRWSRYDVVAIDEVGHVPMAEVGAEYLFQVIADRAEKAAVILTTNLPFSEWTKVIPNTRLCKALIDRITDQAHIIETGQDSYRFKRTTQKRQRQTANQEAVQMTARGNGAKPNNGFTPFPPPLEIAQTTRDSPIHTAPTILLSLFALKTPGSLRSPRPRYTLEVGHFNWPKVGQSAWLNAGRGANQWLK